MNRLFSPAFPRNRGPIRNAIREHLAGASTVLEVASGPGQHAFDFADVLGAHVQPTDRDPASLDSIDAWRDEHEDARVMKALRLDVARHETWPKGPYDAVVAVNFLHMVDLEGCEQFFKLCGQVLSRPQGRVMVYDCFTYQGEHVSESNQAFDQRLRPKGGGVHAVEDLDNLAEAAGLGGREVSYLPANNQAVSWRLASSS